MHLFLLRFLHEQEQKKSGFFSASERYFYNVDFDSLLNEVQEERIVDEQVYIDGEMLKRNLLKRSL